MNAMTMKKTVRKRRASPPRVAEGDILPEYDFSDARPNPYASRIAEGSIMVVLDPDVARLFPDAAAVNDALRALGRIAARAPRGGRANRRST